jgi:outer membrane protein OmpA-like peptidoglycan-associated protein
MFSTRALLATVFIQTLLVGCSISPERAESPRKQTMATTPSPSTTRKTDTKAPEGKPTSDVHDLVLNGECPDPGPAGKAAMAAAGSATIPLKVGLTLSYTWKANADDYDHECLSQVTSMDDRSFSASLSCPNGAKHEIETGLRHVCWTDLMDSYLYIPSWGTKQPQTLRGALLFGPSLASFSALKSHGEFHHRLIQFAADDPQILTSDDEATMKSDGSGTLKLIVNDKLIEVPTIEANYVGPRMVIRIKVSDEPRFPLMLDYYQPSAHRYFITYTKVSFPTSNEVERHLAIDKHTDVYGIYFNFASDVLRPESEPVLKEIATALEAHPDWKLRVNGHTDNIGGEAMNQDLSRRRAQAVRHELAEHYKIAEARLSTEGFGASQPKESNDTDRGRALNRRVELVRQ